MRGGRNRKLEVPVEPPIRLGRSTIWTDGPSAEPGPVITGTL